MIPGVSRETLDELLGFCREIERWNASINLVAPATIEDVWERHIVDSAQLFRICPNSTRWLDLGSGGGLPGIVLAILLKPTPEGSNVLVESNRKKASFLQTMVGRFALPATVLPVRIAEAVGKTGPVDVITARALAPLPQLLEMIQPWMGRGARALLHKGRDYRSELAESAHKWRFDLIEHPSVTDPAAVILELSNLTRKEPLELNRK